MNQCYRKYNVVCFEGGEQKGSAGDHVETKQPTNQPRCCPRTVQL